MHTHTDFNQSIYSSVLLIEDNQHTREHLEKKLTQHSNFYVHAVGTYQAAIERLQKNAYDFLVLDIGLPDGNGLDLIAPAFITNPDALILVLTVFGQDEPVAKAIQAGAQGYLLKDHALDNIHEVLTSMTNGASPIDSRVARSLLQIIVKDAPSKEHSDFKLSDHEELVLHHVSKGMLYKEIACEMNISINTVREYIRRIYKKMNVNSRTKAVQYAYKHGIKLE